jgi:exosortase/archaeosortase family protein
MFAALGSAWLWRGAAAARVIRLPVAILVFAMPLPAPLSNELVFRLQIWTAELSGALLYALGIPHFVAGERILRTEYTFSVIESCSGMRSMETLTLVTILMMDLFRRGTLHAWLVVLAAPPVAFGLNGLRALLLIVNPHSQIAAIHTLQGVAILLTGLVALFLWDGLLERLLPQRARPAAGAPPASAAPAGGARPLAVTGLLALAVAASFGLPPWQPPPPLAGDAAQRLAAGIGISRALEVDRGFLGSVGFQQTFRRSVPWERRDLELFVGMGRRASRVRSPLSPKSGLPGSGFVVEEQRTERLEPGGRAAVVRVLRSGSQRWLVYHWYEGAQAFPAEVLRTLLALDRSPWRHPEEILAIRLAAPLEGPLAAGRPGAEEKILSFYDRLRPLLNELESQLAGKRFS